MVGLASFSYQPKGRAVCFDLLLSLFLLSFLFLFLLFPLARSLAWQWMNLSRVLSLRHCRQASWFGSPQRERRGLQLRKAPGDQLAHYMSVSQSVSQSVRS